MNQKAIRNRLITAFLAHSEGHIKKHLANVEVLLSNPVGEGLLIYFSKKSSEFLFIILFFFILF